MNVALITFSIFQHTPENLLMSLIIFLYNSDRVGLYSRNCFTLVGTTAPNCVFGQQQKEIQNGHCRASRGGKTSLNRSQQCSMLKIQEAGTNIFAKHYA